MRGAYTTSVFLTAVFLFWPILYGSLWFLRKLPGNPLVYSVAGVVTFGLLAYKTYEDHEEEN